VLLLCQGGARLEGVEDAADEQSFEPSDRFAPACAVGVLRRSACAVEGGSVLQAIPRPSRDAQAFGDIVSGGVVARHGRRGSPGEVVVQYLPQFLVRC